MSLAPGARLGAYEVSGLIGAGGMGEVRNQIVSVRVETQGAFSAGATTVPFSDRLYQQLGSYQQYDVAPDGQRFVMVRRVGAERASRLVLVRNAIEGTTKR